MEPITNAEANELRQLVREGGARNARSLYLVEGLHLVATALDEARDKIEFILLTSESNSEEIASKAHALGIEVRSLSQKNAERISDTKTTQGIFAVMKLRPAQEASGDSVVVLDGIQDPGNVGTILRTALWFGVRHMLSSPGTADCYSSKVLRATQGAIFSMDARSVSDLPAELRRLASNGFEIIGASLSPKSTVLSELPLGRKFALVLGSEAQGIHPLVEKECTTLVKIPQIGKGESLNVAVSAGIFLEKLSRK